MDAKAFDPGAATQYVLNKLEPRFEKTRRALPTPPRSTTGAPRAGLEAPRARPGAGTRGLGASGVDPALWDRAAPGRPPHQAPAGSGYFRPPARRATYPRPLTRPGPSPLAQSQRRLLAPGGQGGASRARARGPDVRPAKGWAGKARIARALRMVGSAGLLPLRSQSPPTPRGKKKDPESPSSKLRPWPSLAVQPLAMATARNCAPSTRQVLKALCSVALIEFSQVDTATVPIPHKRKLIFRG